MRLGIFGGTFDPIHYGHLVLAEQCREQCQLDEVLFLPAGTPPHKEGQPLTPAKDRAEMVELAIAGHPAFHLDRRELHRPGPSYTVDTLTELRQELPDAQLFFLIGADSLDDLPQWRDPQRIVQLATLVVVNRGPTLPTISAALTTCLGEAALSRIQHATIPPIGISSRDLRQRLRDARTIRYFTPRPVECYIQTHALYSPPREPAA